jgi:hypothetical protein
MSQVEIIAVATIAIARKQRVAILGSLLLFVGVFLPLVSTPLGSVNYFDNGQGDGAIVLALAVISIILALTRSFGWLWITGLCSVGLPVYYLVTILNGLSRVRENMQTELEDNPFKDLADLAINSVQIQWGWAILMLGGVMVIVAAALPPQHAPITMLGRMFGKAINVLAAVCCLMWLLGYFDIMDNWVYRHSPLANKLSKHPIWHAPNKQISGSGDIKTPSPPQSAPTPTAQASPPPPQVVEHSTDASQSPVPQQPPATTAIPPAPAAEESKPTSGVLCNGPVEVRQNWEFTFRNLPGGQLKFTFDHDAWLPLIHREPDGTQTVIMRSIKPGIQTKCDIRWEIAQ